MFARMVTRRRLRTVLTTLALYAFSALAIGYFGVNAYTGNRGLIARQDLEHQIVELNAGLEAMRSERAVWERRISLLKSDRLDPDLLDERARALLNYVGPKDVTLLLRQP